MVYEFRLPDVGEGVAEGEVVKWFVAEGDVVQEDGPLVSVLTDKANVEIPSPKSGKILRLHAAVGEKVKVGGLLVTIDAEGTAAPTAATATATAATAVPAIPSSALPPSAPPPGPAPGARVLATPAIRRLASERGLDLNQIRGSGPGGRITEADLAGGAASVAPASAPPAILSAPPAGAEAPSESTAPPAPVPTSAPGSPPPTAPLPTSATDERVPIRGLRRVSSEHMAHATHTAAHFTYVEEIDVTELVRLRDRMSKHVEKHGVKLSYLPFIVKAVIAGLREHPWMNASMDDARQELVIHHDYNIGIATAAPDGLLVPVLHHADQKSVSAIAKEIAGIAERARAGKLTRAELTGGTFTITSLGALGGVLATPILNYPEVGILGVHRIVRRPVYKSDGTLVPADLMNLSVSLDHRVLDGIVGAQFLSVVKSNLEDPHQLFAELA
ncbi:MAG: 2-oxo acid dehydrogenase subunit E2 [Thermoplasmata archaeon]|nr:2-oxo acid dehydrogenase subunit E2 [Thermoplasmata archaeon]